MRKLVLLLIIVACTFSCKKETIELSKTDYLVFGHFYGECMGEKCIEIFRLETNKLFEDTNDRYPGSTDFYKGNWAELSQAEFDATKDLIQYFPEDLLSETNTRIGQPDAGDWGGLYIEYNYKGKHKFWLIDQMKSHVPDKYHAFIDKVNEKIKALQ